MHRCLHAAIVITPPVTARALAAGLEPGAKVEWQGLEVAAFDAHPDVLEQLDPSGRYNGGKKRLGRLHRQLTYLMWPFIALAFVFLFSPVMGFAFMFSAYFRTFNANPDFAVRIPAAGVCFAVSVVALLALAAAWLRQGRRDEGFLKGEAWVVLVLGGLSAMKAASTGPEGGVAHWERWTAVMATAAVVGAVMVVAEYFLRRPAIERTDDLEPLRHVRLAIERLAAPDRQVVSDDLSGAIRDLVDRRVVTPAEAEWACGAEPGKLAMRMSQRPRTG